MIFFFLNHLSYLIVRNFLLFWKGSGLSSSAALVCSFALATMYANRVSISKVHFIFLFLSLSLGFILFLNPYRIFQRDMAEICAASEQYVGVQAGGYTSFVLIFLSLVPFISRSTKKSLDC